MKGSLPLAAGSQRVVIDSVVSITDTLEIGVTDTESSCSGAISTQDISNGAIGLSLRLTGGAFELI